MLVFVEQPRADSRARWLLDYIPIVFFPFLLALNRSRKKPPPSINERRVNITFVCTYYSNFADGNGDGIGNWGRKRKEERGRYSPSPFHRYLTSCLDLHAGLCIRFPTCCTSARPVFPRVHLPRKPSPPPHAAAGVATTFSTAHPWTSSSRNVNSIAKEKGKKGRRGNSTCLNIFPNVCNIFSLPFFPFSLKKSHICVYIYHRTLVRYVSREGWKRKRSG